VDQRAGISATVLARNAVDKVAHGSARPLADRELAGWLVEQRLAVRLPDGRLEATKLGRRSARCFARSRAPERITPMAVSHDLRDRA
jgi:hypothetical protein